MTFTINEKEITTKNIKTKPFLRKKKTGLLGNVSDIFKSNSKIKFCFTDFNGYIKITLTEKLDNQLVHRFQYLDEFKEIITKINDQDIHLQNSKCEEIL